MTRKKKGFCDWFNLVVAIWIIISEVFLNAFCLKDLKIFVPEAVITGNAAALTCEYELEHALYSVRWYFKNEEFYRYVPKESPPAIVFHVSGIIVDVSSSNATSVTLRSVSRELSGDFKCEVSEDAPKFHTRIKSARMQVVELPKDEPDMHIDKKNISSSDSFKAICTVGKSYPAPNITWSLNGRKVLKHPDQRIVYRQSEASPTFSSLEMQPSSALLQELFYSATTGKMSPHLYVVCEISILHVYHKEIQVKIPMKVTSLTTVTPNLLGLEKASIGDPDNSPLTGGIGRSINTTIFNICHVIISIIFFCYFSNL